MIFDLDNMEKSKDTTQSSTLKTPQKSSDPNLGSPHEQVKRLTRRNLIRFSLALVGAILLWRIAYMFRYEIIPINVATAGIVEYIVKDRWTGEIEVVWQNPKEFRRSSRQPFE